jgi:uncharacterized protein YjbJ (UPF0337 family)
MNAEQIQNHWSTLKGKLKQRYGQLTDDDLTFAEGKGEELVDRLRKKLGISRRELETTLDDLASQAESSTERLKAKAAEVSEHVRAKAGVVMDDLKQKAVAVGEEAKVQGAVAYDAAQQRARGILTDGEEYIRANPRDSLVAALAAGFFAGIILLRR